MINYSYNSRSETGSAATEGRTRKREHTRRAQRTTSTQRIRTEQSAITHTPHPHSLALSLSLSSHPTHPNRKPVPNPNPIVSPSRRHPTKPVCCVVDDGTAPPPAHHGVLSHLAANPVYGYWCLPLPQLGRRGNAHFLPLGAPVALLLGIGRARTQREMSTRACSPSRQGSSRARDHALFFTQPSADVEPGRCVRATERARVPRALSKGEGGDPTLLFRFFSFSFRRSRAGV